MLHPSTQLVELQNRLESTLQREPEGNLGVLVWPLPHVKSCSYPSVCPCKGHTGSLSASQSHGEIQQSSLRFVDACEAHSMWSHLPRVITS